MIAMLVTIVLTTTIALMLVRVNMTIKNNNTGGTGRSNH